MKFKKENLFAQYACLEAYLSWFILFITIGGVLGVIFKTIIGL